MSQLPPQRADRSGPNSLSGLSASFPDDPRLVQAVQEYLRDLESGRRPDRQSLVSRYPDLADALNDCLDGLELVHQAAPHAEPAAPANPLGDFQIVHEIARGGMGIVYEATQLSLGRQVALKVLPFAATFDTRQLQRFRHEAQAAAQLHHTNIVPVYAVGCERGIHFYAMQLIDGQSLDAVIRQVRKQAREAEGAVEGPAADPSSLNPKPQPSSSWIDATDPWTNGSPDHLAAAESKEFTETFCQLSTQLSTQRSTKEGEFYRVAARWMAQAAEALEYAHQEGVIHRDVKPGNLLIDSRGNLWITDFGLAHFHADAGLTQTGDLLGTVRYMSPEQAAGQRVVLDHRTDIYSLGATFYELLTLEPVFGGATRQALLHQVLNQEPRPLRSVDRRIPLELETILLKALSKNPADRYASSQALADDLHRFLRYEPIQARRPSSAEVLRKWARRHPSLIASGVAALFLVLVVSLVANWRVTQANNRANAAFRQERLLAEEAELRFAQARQAVDLLIDVCQRDLADKPPLQGLRRQLLETSLVYYQDFIAQRRSDPSSQAELIAVREKVKKILDDLSVLEGAGHLVLLSDERIQADLALTAAQRRQLAAITQEFSQRRLASLRDLAQLSPNERRARFFEWARGNEQVMRATLEPAQLHRLQQITIQLQGTMAFTQPEIASQLELTDTQRQAIRQIEMEAFGSMWEYFRRGKTEASPRQFRETLLKTSVQQVLAVLTPQQVSRWTELTGKPLEGIPDTPSYVPSVPLRRGKPAPRETKKD
jgi:serine/threonine protein kinase